jgi:NAD(P)-dependent dehydrogenase (short-subunit alcohol dehydrogenase family)
LTAKPAALVTGAARRIGAAIAADLAAHGWRVAIHHYASDKAARALVRSIVAKGGEAVAFRANLADSGETAGLLPAVARQFGRVDLLVNNASVFLPDSAAHPDWNAWEAHFAVHVRASAQLAAAFAAQRGMKSGLIVNVIDQRVKRLNPRFFSYTLSKSALWTATRTMAQQFAPRIRVNAIAPGPTLKNERQSAADFARQVAGLPLKRGPQLAEFGAAIRFLAACPSVTGQMLALDGGQHLAWETPDVAGIAE